MTEDNGAMQWGTWHPYTIRPRRSNNAMNAKGGTVSSGIVASQAVVSRDIAARRLADGRAQINRKLFIGVREVGFGPACDRREITAGSAILERVVDSR